MKPGQGIIGLAIIMIAGDKGGNMVYE